MNPGRSNHGTWSRLAQCSVRAVLFGFSELLLAGCMTVGSGRHEAREDGVTGPVASQNAGMTGTRRIPGAIAQSDRFVIYRPEPGDSYRTIAKRVLGSESLYWIVEDFNEGVRIEPSVPVVIPLTNINPARVWEGVYQTVPILCYHKIGVGNGKVTVRPEAFLTQMKYLADHNYRVIPLRHFLNYLAGASPLPRRAVVITVDDGDESSYSEAFPVFKAYSFPFTLFVQTDAIGRRHSLTWDQLRHMGESGLADIQPHSMSHADLAKRLVGESTGRYRERLLRETQGPKVALAENLGTEAVSFAYPYGSVAAPVVDAVVAADYESALTVKSGGNSAFQHPYLLRRTMVYRDDDLRRFSRKLEVYRPLPGKEGK